MDLLTLTRQLKEDTVAPVYLLHGDERFLISRFVDRLKGLVVIGPMADFNYARKKAQETTGAQVVADARSLPMMAKQRLIIIDDADKLKSADLEALLGYVENPVPETCLVLIGKKFDLRRGFFKKANGRKMVHKAESLKENQVPAFISQRARNKKMKIDEQAVMAIAQAVGPDCAALDDAVERVGLYAGGEEIHAEDVATVVSSVRTHSVFELVDALGTRKSAQVLRLLSQLLSNREEPIRINAMLARHMRQLLSVRIYRHQGMDQQGMMSALGVPPFVVKKLMAQSNGFRGPQLEAALRRLADVDLELKSSRRPGERILENALMDLCL